VAWPLWIASETSNSFAAPASSAPDGSFDYAEPKRLTGTLYALDSNQKLVLFTFRRTATRAGSRVRVERRFDLPDGSTGAVENIVYESDHLVSYEMKEVQAGLWGTIQIYPDPIQSGREELTIAHGRDTEVRGKGTSSHLPKDTLIDDTLYPFILMHWNDLMQGTSVKFRFVALEWERTFGFKLSKAGESVRNGKAVVCMKMEPTSMIVARFMNPIYFTIEKDAPHRMLEYVGRTTPRFKKGKVWKYLDAETVFDWQ
jgi:hypothetical protein